LAFEVHEMMKKKKKKKKILDSMEKDTKSYPAINQIMMANNDVYTSTLQLLL